MTHQFLLHFHRSSGLVQPRAVRVAERMPTDLSEFPRRDLACFVDENSLAVCRGALPALASTLDTNQGDGVPFIGEEFPAGRALVHQVHHASDKLDRYVATCTNELRTILIEKTALAASLCSRRSGHPDAHDSWRSIHFWYWEHWKFFRAEVKTSIVQGIAVFLSLFETNAQVRRVFCPPKELYEGKHCATDPDGVVLPQFSELIETGKVVGLNFPTALNPALAKIIGTMMKADYQRSVLLRIPEMDSHSGRHFRPTVFLCDEYQNFAIVGGDNPTGDERFLSLSQQPKCIPIVATQSISSLKEALPNEGIKTLLQAFRTKIFLSTSDPDTARYSMP